MNINVQALGVKKLPLSCNTATGIKYLDSLKGTVGDIGSMDFIMKSIKDLNKSNGTYFGHCYDGHGVTTSFIICPDLGNETHTGLIRGLCGKDRATIDLRNCGQSWRLRFNLHFGVGYTNASTLVACLELLLAGYYLDDWNQVQVNHLDNSAGTGSISGRIKEELDPENLELFIKKDSKLNTKHGSTWSRIYKQLGIRSSFSLYNSSFISFIDGLVKNKQLDLQHVMQWPNIRIVKTKDGDIYHFD